MAFIPGFEYDLFVSYPSADDEWVRRFVKDFTEALGVILGQDVSFYLGPDLKNHHIASDEVAPDHSALFVPIISPAFLDKRWALEQIEVFSRFAERDRIIPIERLPIEEDRVPPPLRGLSRIRLWSQPDQERPATLTPKSDPDAYRKRVLETATQVFLRLHDLYDRSTALPDRKAFRGPSSAPLQDLPAAAADEFERGLEERRRYQERSRQGLEEVLRQLRRRTDEAEMDALAQREASSGIEAKVHPSIVAPQADRKEGTAPPRTIHGQGPSRHKEAVEFAVSNPSIIQHGVIFLVYAWAFLPQDREAVTGLAQKIFGSDAALQPGTTARVARGTELQVELQAGPWSIEPKFQTITWTGHVTHASFHVKPDAHVPNGIVPAVCRITMRGRRVCEIHFNLTLGQKQGATQLTPAKRLLIFCSYASKNRSRVLGAIVGIEKFADVFLDIRDLKSGAP